MAKSMNELEKAEKTESKIIKRFLLFSAFSHLVIALFYIIKLPTKPVKLESIEAELVLTTQLNQPKKKVENKKSKVEKNTLPQLTKNMILKEKRQKKAIAIASLKAKQEKERKRKKSLEKLKYIELTKKEAIKRLLRERARLNKDIAEKEKIRLNESIKHLKSLNDDINVLGASNHGNYLGVVKSWVKRHYEIADSYNVSKEGIEIFNYNKQCSIQIQQKKQEKNLKEVLQKKKGLPSRKRWKCSMKKCWMICW